PSRRSRGRTRGRGLRSPCADLPVWESARAASAPLPEEVFDGGVDRVLVGDLAERDVRRLTDVLAQVLDELPAAVRRLDLAVGELIHVREDLGLEQVDAQPRVVGRPVVSVAEVKGVDVPAAGRVL